jgi:hypothetical protein
MLKPAEIPSGAYLFSLRKALKNLMYRSLSATQSQQQQDHWFYAKRIKPVAPVWPLAFCYLGAVWTAARTSSPGWTSSPGQTSSPDTSHCQSSSNVQ